MAGVVRTDLVETPGNPIPDGTSSVVVRTADGIGLRLAHWPAMPGAMWGTVVLMQGRAEFMEKYFETVEHFRGRGFDVVSFDWRGQGGSERLTRNPHKGHVRRFTDYDLDIEAVFAEMEERGRPRPWFVVAHSMGGAILLAKLGRGPLPIERAALSAPMLGFSPDIAPGYAGAAAATLAWLGLGRMFIPGGGPNSIAMKPFANNRLSTDAARYERNAAILTAAPDLGIGDPTVDWIDGASRMMRALSAPGFARKIKVPLLILASGVDRVVSTRVTERFASGLKTGDAIIIKGARHELLMESDICRAQVLAALDAFIPGGQRSERAVEVPAVPA
ncbi:lysophospholipase [Rhizobiales bacterium GAS191]|jgi:lysophospholipase|nr:lysophospholipase [Rhizobiales bacterium GAS113]SED47097.1 lysophospholipase [Rhizobiales bacterium GAS191]